MLLSLMAFSFQPYSVALVAVGSNKRECMPAQISEARKLLIDNEIERSLNSDRVVREALRAAQQDGIVFIDEIDKIVETSRGVGGATSTYQQPLAAFCNGLRSQFRLWLP